MIRSLSDWLLLALVIALGSVALASCFGTGGSDGAGSNCVPGESRQCACADGRSGRQVCRDDGRSLAPCECVAPAVAAAGPDAAPAVQPGSLVPPPPTPPIITTPALPVSPLSLPAAPPPSQPVGPPAIPFQEDSATVALWHLDEVGGASPADSGPSKVSATVRGVTWAIGHFGGAAMLSGTGSNIQATANDSFFPGVSITIEAWVRPDASGDMTIYDIQDTQGLGLRARGADSEAVLRLRINDQVRTLASTEPVTLRQWHHIAGTFDGIAMRLWIDGQLKGELNVPGTIRRAMLCETPTIGSDCTATAGWFIGAIDEVRVSNIARYVPEAGSTLVSADAGAGQRDAGQKTTKRDKKRDDDKTIFDVAGETARKALKSIGL